MNVVPAPVRALLVLALLLSASKLSAQTRIMVFAGASVASLEGEGSDPSAGSRTGIHVGAASDLPILFAGRLSFMPGGQLIEKGFSHDSGNFDLRLYYLEVLAQLKLSVPLGGLFSVNLFGGPGAALGFGCVEKVRDEGVERQRDCEPSEFGIKGWDLVGLAGAGVAVHVTPQASILLNGAYDTSLTSVASSAVQGDLKNRAWLIQAGVSFLPLP
jgi:hypothetical protein